MFEKKANPCSNFCQKAVDKQMFWYYNKGMETEQMFLPRPGVYTPAGQQL